MSKADTQKELLTKLEVSKEISTTFWYGVGSALAGVFVIWLVVSTVGRFESLESRAKKAESAVECLRSDIDRHRSYQQHSDARIDRLWMELEDLKKFLAKRDCCP